MRRRTGASRRKLALAAFALPALCALTSACAATVAPHHAPSLPSASPFDENADAAALLAAAQARAASEGRMVLAVFGANWCHDSRVLAGWLASGELAALVAAHFEVVYIDAGIPQTGHGRNLELARQSGVSDIVGTPSLLVLGPDGTLRNTPEDARSWRNAASRSEADIMASLQAFIPNSD